MNLCPMWVVRLVNWYMARRFAKRRAKQPIINNPRRNVGYNFMPDY